MKHFSVPKKKMTHNVAMKLKHHDAKFCGDFNECWDEYLDSYNQNWKDYCLSRNEKMHYLHKLLYKDAFRFYLDTVQPHAVRYQ